MKSLNYPIAAIAATILSVGTLQAQPCLPGTIPVWIAKGGAVALGCTAVGVSTSPAKLGQNSQAPIAVMVPLYGAKGAAASTLQPSVDLSSTLSSLNQAVSDLQAAKKKDEATISSLQKQLADLQTKLANQPAPSQGQDQSGNDDNNTNDKSQTSDSLREAGSQSGKVSESKNAVYAPFEVKSKTTGMVLFRVVEGKRGGRIFLFDSSGAEVAAFGASETRLGGSIVVQTPDGGSHIGMAFNGNTGYLQIDSNGTMQAELGPGRRSSMGLHIWNPSKAEVVALEAMPGGNGGLWIGNMRGGTAATIAPNKDGVGIYHGITAVMPLNHP